MRSCDSKAANEATADLAKQAQSDDQRILAALNDKDIQAQVDQALASVEGGIVEKMLSFFDSSGKASADRKVEVQDVKMDDISNKQRKFLKLSALGQVLLDGVGKVLSALPFGGVQLASLLSAVYGRTLQTVKNSSNCYKLLKQIQFCDKQLGSFIRKQGVHHSGRQAPPLPQKLLDGLHTIGVVVQRAAVFIIRYTERNSLMAFITSSFDKATYEKLDAMLREAMLDVSFATSGLVLGRTNYVDENEVVMKKICEAAHMPVSPESAKAALEKLQLVDSEKLRKLVLDEAPFSTKVVQAQLDALSERVLSVEGTVGNHGLRIAVIEVALAQLKRSNAETADGSGLAPYLHQWWNDQGWQFKRQVACPVFQDRLWGWLQENRPEAIVNCHKEMVEQGLVINMEVTGQGAQVFLELVVMKLLDQDGDGQVTRKELYRLQVLAHEQAKQPDVLHPPPGDWVDLFNILFMGFANTLLKAPVMLSSGGINAAVMPAGSSNALVGKVQTALKVADDISSYKVADLMDEYVQDSRQWMYDKVDAWLDAITGGEAATKGCKSEVQRQTAAARMLLLLADAGMGKSVFSAVMQTKLRVRTNESRNLVAVGQARASGKVAILCLAHQLAGVLDGMAAELEEVVKEHGDAGDLSIMDTCDKYLVQPLLALAAPDKPPMPQVLLLLDAMDEADDGTGRGWQPVASLLSRELLKLPSNVHVLVTGRPEVADRFKAWPRPVTITPHSKDNINDMKLVVRDRLTKRDLLTAGEDVDAATQVIVNSSKGQFIYIKFVFNFLAWRQSWTVAQLQAPGVLPTGLAGAFQLAFSTLQAALQREKPELLHVLHKQMLPVLVVAQEPLSVSQLSWLGGGQEAQLVELLECAANLFPLRGLGVNDQLRIVPYHKTVLDWLTAEVVTDAATGKQHVAAYSTEQLTWMEPGEVPTTEFRVDPQQGHMQAAAACHAAAMSLPLSDPQHTPYIRPQPNDLQLYVLRHTVAHLHAAKNLARLKSLVLQLGFWEWVYAAGCGAPALHDLLKLARDMPTSAAPQVKDVIRWLRTNHLMLAQHPMATLQLACDAPLNSLISKHASTLPVKPLAQLLTKEISWESCIRVCAGHTHWVNSVAISPDGKTFVSGSEDMTIRVWDLGTGECQSLLTSHSDKVTSVAISPDGKTIVSGSNDWDIRVWGVDAGECRSTLKGHTDWVNSVAISPDGRTILSASKDKTIRVWNLDKGECKSTLQGHTDQVISVAISPDGNTLVSGSGDRTIKKWDLGTGKCRYTLKGHAAAVNSVAISPDGKTLVSGSEDSTIRVWDLGTGQCKRTMQGQMYEVASVAVSPDGKSLVSGSWDNTISVWDLDTGTCSTTLQGHSNCVLSVALTSDGKTLVSGAGDNAIRVWDLDMGGHTCTTQGRASFADIDVTSVASHGLTSIYGLADKYNGRTLVFRSGSCFDRKFLSRDGKTLVLMKDKLISFVISSHLKHAQPVPPAVGTCQHCTPQPAACMCTQEQDGRPCTSSFHTRVWDMDTGRCVARSMPRGHADAVMGVAISPEGSNLSSGLRANRAAAEPRVFLDTYSTYAAISPDGKTLVSGSYDKTIRVWDIKTGDCRSTLQGHTETVTSVAISPDSRTLVSGSCDHTVRVWDLKTCKCRNVLEGHTRSVDIVAISPDGKTLLSEESTIWCLAPMAISKGTTLVQDRYGYYHRVNMTASGEMRI